MDSIITVIQLRPGFPPNTDLRECFRLIFEDFAWFRPHRYRGVGMAGHVAILPGSVPLDAFVAACRGEERHATHSVMILKSDQEFLSMSFTKPNEEFRYVGALNWITLASFSARQAWREHHVSQVGRLMKLLRSPYGFASLSSEEDRKLRRLVPNEDGFGSRQELTVRDYSEGLAGIFWRNFYGPPFVELFGDRLKALPPGTFTDLGDGLAFVQPYQQPEEALTPRSREMEERLVSLLGPEHFYDFTTHQLPKRQPRLQDP